MTNVLVAIAYALNLSVEAVLVCFPPNPTLVELRVISVPTTSAVRLLPRLLRSPESETGFQELDRLVTEGKGRLQEISIAWINPNDLFWKDQSADASGASENQTELSYPTDHEEPSMGPLNFGAPAEQDPKKSADKAWPRQPYWGPNTPTSFQCVRLGMLFQVHPNLPDRTNEIELVIEARSTQLVRFTEFLLNTSPVGVTGCQVVPTFQREAIVTSVRLSSGKRKVFATVTNIPDQTLSIYTIQATTLTTR